LFEFVNNFNHSLIKRRITMMTKGKSKSWAKSKFLLMIPVICFLVLAFANPKPASSTDPAITNHDPEKIALDGPNGAAITSDQEVADDTKQKEKQKKLKQLLLNEKKLKELYAKIEDAEKKKLIEKELAQIQKLKEAEGWVENGPRTISEKEYVDATKKIKTLLETTEDPKKREELKVKLKDLQEMKSKGLVKPTNIDYEKEALILKEMFEKEKDPEKKKLIEEKLVQLKEMAAKEKAKKKVK
jgi:hypothetical protein